MSSTSTHYKAYSAPHASSSSRSISGSGAPSSHHQRSSSTSGSSSRSSSHHRSQHTNNNGSSVPSSSRTSRSDGRDRSSGSSSASRHHHQQGHGKDKRRTSSSRDHSKSKGHHSSSNQQASTSSSVLKAPIVKISEHPLKEMKSAFLCNMRFQTGLPQIQLDPVILEYPVEKDLSNLVEYNTTSLEKNHKFELLTETTMGVNINLINPFVYSNSTGSNKLDPEDEALLKPVKSKTEAIGAEKQVLETARPSWLKAPTYVDMINYKNAVKGYGGKDEMMATEEKVVKIKGRTISRREEEKLRFEKAKQLDEMFAAGTLCKTLPGGGKSKAVACFSLLPDMDTMNTNYLAVNFGSDNHYLLGKRGRKHQSELTPKDASDSLLLIRPTEDIIDSEKTNDDRFVDCAQYYVPVSASTQDEDAVLDPSKNVGNIVEMVREYTGTIYEKNLCSVNMSAENQQRFKLANRLLARDKMSQAEIEPCVAMKFDRDNSKCFYTFIKEGVNFKVVAKKRKRRVFTKVKLAAKGNEDEDVPFEDMQNVLSRVDEFQTKASSSSGYTKGSRSNEDEEGGDQDMEEAQQRNGEDSEEEVRLGIDEEAATDEQHQPSTKKKRIDDEDEDEEEEANNENLPTSPNSEEEATNEDKAPQSEEEDE
ncbi:hypothetical protein FDP41_006716 [Naegleria fowleri]|uniref:Uncharacterized protein n=1 Tax=Naegleria fowleri TaxID=5763 RepID=A0A6A5BHD0_NAEFO|nr:uncharacterized protein FDP41_006716 [Naegleria fowleri]KAF0974106.1 hypothetical protein FDP41_006716 [Naegleria fowleri]CAG4708391.1 unnamed protein product [Naegleria fowleri]